MSTTTDKYLLLAESKPIIKPENSNNLSMILIHIYNFSVIYLYIY